jgi:histidinol-phosphate aminotransferase
MSNAINFLARPEIVAMRAYQSARSECSYGEIFLDANENALGDVKYKRYPEQQPSSLLLLLAALYGVNQDQLLMTRGSDEGIDLLTRVFCRDGKDSIMICPPTYGMYEVAAAIQGANVIEVPLLRLNGFSLDTDAILKRSENTKIIFLCSPNNPTGNLLNVTDILLLCKRLLNQSIIVVDEAYIEFSQTESITRYLNAYPNLVVLRTLSKAYGLAGLRCGVTIACKELISLMKKIISPYPVSSPVAEIACEKIQSDVIDKSIAIIRNERERLSNFLQSLTFIKKVWPSETNFILVETDDAEWLMRKCFAVGIVLRNRSQKGIENSVRLTIGTPDENNQLMRVLQNV